MSWNSQQIGADSRKLLAEILVKIFAREYHDITTTFLAHLHELVQFCTSFFDTFTPSYDICPTLLRVYKSSVRTIMLLIK